MAKTLSKKENKKDVFSLLKDDHDEVKALFKKLMTGKTKEETFERIVKALDYHMDYEETYLYPELKGTKVDFEILEAEEEHKVGKNIPAELISERKDSDRWLAKAKVFKEIVEHHVKEEEDGLFGKAKKILGKEKSERLGNQFIMGKENALI